MKNKKTVYYEIVLTHRQTVILFTIIVLILPMTFLLGIWIGQKIPRKSERKVVVVEEIPKSAIQSEETNTKTAKYAEPLEELENEKETSEELPSNTAGNTITAPEETNKNSTTDALNTITDHKSETNKTTTKNTTTSRGYFIQIMATESYNKAEKERKRLEEKGLPTHISKIIKNGKTLYRVRIGPFENIEKATEVKSTLPGNKNFIITK